MITRRPSEARGHTQIDWLNSRHTFSFGDYFDHENVGFRSLRVINEDIVAPGQGFGTHAHENMEIVTCVLEGELEHRDSMGHGSVLRPGEMQRMSAGTGLTHSEFNPSKSQEVHFLQIWLVPAQRGITPSWEQKSFDVAGQRGKLVLVASPDAREGSLLINQDARIYLVTLAGDDRIVYPLDGSGLSAEKLATHHLDSTDLQTRRGWLQVLKGTVKLSGIELMAGDGAALEDEAKVDLVVTEPSSIMLFDLA